jgi:hypothetical protein
VPATAGRRSLRTTTVVLSDRRDGLRDEDTDMTNDSWQVETADGTEVACGMDEAAARARAKELNAKRREEMGDDFERTRDGFYAARS